MSRVLAHAHTTWSHDGHLPLDAYIELARRTGCSAVLLTEHEESGWTAERYAAYARACNRISTADVRLVPGLEFNQNGYHVLCYGLQRLPTRASSIEDLAAAVHQQGCVLVLAHPAKYGWRIPSDLLRAVDAVELWNSKWIYDGKAGPHPKSLALATGKRIVAGQDVHKLKHLSPLVMVTDTDDLLRDFRIGRYAFASGDQQWSIEALRDGSRNAAARRHRVMMDAVLRAYRTTRRVRRPSTPSQRRPPAQPPEPLPRVSIVLPVRNERAYIGRALSSVLAQDYPASHTEILVADGCSDDGTREVVRGFEDQAGGRLRLIDNPGRIVPTGLNAALRAASGDVIVRVDGHCEIPSDFVRRAVHHLSLNAVDCVGGVLETVGETPLARVIAVAMSARFGVGGSAFRCGSAVSRLTDTVAFPAFTRDILDRTGEFDEELVRNQDDEYSYRLRRLGGRILLATDMRARYYSRSTLRMLWRQCFQYGFWKVRVLQKHPRQVRPRQFVPALFVATLAVVLASLVVSPVAQPLLAAIAAAYLLAAFLASFSEGARLRWSLRPVLIVSFAVMHVGYGSGFLVGLLRFRRRWRRVAFETAPLDYHHGEPV
jgi:glycosyltransferase involved in cell wall biosynthesis/predicted metal-dependent phosphoesterase TrpH